MKTNLLEDNRNDLLAKSKRADSYAADNQSLGKNRYQRRLQSSVSKTVKEFNEIDMNKLFGQNILDFSVKVTGETDDYFVHLSFNNFLQTLRGYMEKFDNVEKLELRTVLKALMDCFNHSDVYIHCTCPDWRYRMDYWAHTNNIASTDRPDDPQDRASDKTNPNDTKGAGCKHSLLVLSNTSWMMKLASVICNYINYMQEHYPKLYADVIYPAIFEKEYEEPVQLDINDNKDMPTSQNDIDAANKWAKTKSQFKVGNEYRFKPNQNIPGQKHFDFDREISD